MSTSDLQRDRQFALDSLYAPAAFVLLLWFIKILETSMGWSFSSLGVLPRNIEGLGGIFTAPLIHGDAREFKDVLGDFSHLFSNSFPLIVLGFVLMQSYRKFAFSVFGFIYIGSGLLVWIFARNGADLGYPVYHIGASGVVYGLAFFIFFSGVFRKDTRSMALALMVCFLYGSLVWGLLPIQEGVSWEAHVSGALTGIIAAAYYRKDFRKKRYAWEFEREEDLNNIVEKPYWLNRIPQPEAPPKIISPLQVKYIIKPTNKDQSDKEELGKDDK